MALPTLAQFRCDMILHGWKGGSRQTCVHDGIQAPWLRGTLRPFCGRSAGRRIERPVAALGMQIAVCHPTARRPRSTASTIVMPIPHIGSTTRSPRSEYVFSRPARERREHLRRVPVRSRHVTAFAAAIGSSAAHAAKYQAEGQQSSFLFGQACRRRLEALCNEQRCPHGPSRYTRHKRVWPQ
jgi:hypothetical protein